MPAQRRIYIRLPRPIVDQLVRVAEAERRHPSDQAALYIERALQHWEEAASVAVATKR